jgi:hypothetical protein
MAERESRVETYLVDYHCDTEGCGVKIEATNAGIEVKDNVPYFQHKCPICDRVYSFPERKYPYTRMRYI